MVSQRTIKKQFFEACLEVLYRSICWNDSLRNLLLNSSLLNQKKFIWHHSKELFLGPVNTFICLCVSGIQARKQVNQHHLILSLKGLLPHQDRRSSVHFPPVFTHSFLPSLGPSEPCPDSWTVNQPQQGHEVDHRWLPPLTLMLHQPGRGLLGKKSVSGNSNCNPRLHFRLAL